MPSAGAIVQSMLAGFLLGVTITLLCMAFASPFVLLARRRWQESRGVDVDVEWGILWWD